MILLQAPSSKSVSHRMLIGAALANGQSVVERVLESKDLEQTMAILQGAGVQIQRQAPGVYAVIGAASALSDGLKGGATPESPLSCDVHESGTTCRLLTAVLATGKGSFRLHGATRMHERPIGELTSALRDLGVVFHFEGQEGFPPFVMTTEGLKGQEVAIGLEESSQYLSGLLLAAPLAYAPLCLSISGDKVVSWPYVGLTLQTLETFGVPFTVEQKEEDAEVWGPADWRTLREIHPGCLRFRMQPAAYQAGRYAVEGDWSGASYFLAAGAIGSRPLRMEGLRADSLQGDRAMLDILREMGAQIEVTADAVTVYPSRLHGVTVDMGNCPDLVPTVAVMAAFAEGTTTVRNVAHLRIKESDRIAAPAQELARVGIQSHEHPDGLSIEGQGQNFAGHAEGPFSAHGDHRIAMSLALLELKGTRIVLDNPACVSKSFPTFWEQWDQVRP